MTITLTVLSSNNKTIDIYNFNNQLISSNSSNELITLPHDNYQIYSSGFIQDVSLTNTLNSNSLFLIDVFYFIIGLISLIVLFIVLKAIKKHGLRF